MNRTKLSYIAGGIACLLFASVLLHVADNQFGGFSTRDEVVEETVGITETTGRHATNKRESGPVANRCHSGRQVTKSKETALPRAVDLNSASEEELDTLPGVGAKTAAAIVRYRQARGGFKRREDLLEVRGIGVKKYEKLKDRVTVGK